MKSAQKQKGFALVELLVVISIMAILTTMAMVVYSGLQSQSRDAKRQSDLKTIQSALEQYRADQGFYPLSIIFGGSLTSGTKTYLKEIPKDPIGTPEYFYKAYKVVHPVTPTDCLTAPECIDYCLYARVENSANEKDTDCPVNPLRKLEVTRP